MTSLDQIPMGGRFRVNGVTLSREIGKRLSDMGFTQGAEGRVLRRAMLGGPIHVSIIGYQLTVRTNEARGIEVEALEAAAPAPKEHRPIVVGLAGNPNCGKTTLFNALTGSHQKVGNYAGVTVDKKEGRRRHQGKELRIFDLPGTYSLTAYSIDEMVARDFLINDRPDVIVNVLDATNLERNLYLSSQFMELGLPIVGVLNIADQADSMGIEIDTDALSTLLGFPIVRTVGTRGRGLNELLDAITAVKVSTRRPSYGSELEAELDKLHLSISTDAAFCAIYPPHWMALKLLEKDAGAMATIRGRGSIAGAAHEQAAAVLKQAEHSIAWLENHFGRDAEIIVTEQRYAFIRGALAETQKRPPEAVTKPSTTGRFDRILMHRWLGLPIFLGIIWAMFQITFLVGQFPTQWLELFFSWLSGVVRPLLPDGGLLQSLVVDGIIGGVGGVFSFVPLIIILFMLISILEDLGYMARAAFIMDRFLHIFGLHGQSFLPMMLGFGCSVPAIMAARTLKSPKDRILTVMIIPFMSCGAKLPVHVLLAGAFFPRNAGTIVMLMYGIGVGIALVSALVLRKTVLQGEQTPFVMELPPYRLPTLRGIGWHVVDKTWMYVKRAGTTILAASILIWFITTFPQVPVTASAPPTSQAASPALVVTSAAALLVPLVASDTTSPATNSATNLEYSFAGRIGKFLEGAVQPLGFDWKVAVAMVTGFAAKEVVVSTLGIIYRVEENGTASSGNPPTLSEALRADPHMNPLAAFNLMLCILLVTPCIAAMATIRAELGGKWLVFAVVFTLGMAWVVCFGVWQLGSLFGLAGAI